MANPQPDKHTRISNEWFEAFITAQYPASIKNFVMAVVRETWGWNETWREIPAARFCELLKIDERRFYQVRDDALRHNLIECLSGEVRGAVPTYRVQKDYIDWIDYRPTERSQSRANRLKAALPTEGGPSAKAALQSTTEGGPSQPTEGGPSGLYKDERQLKTEERQGEYPPLSTSGRGMKRDGAPMMLTNYCRLSQAVQSVYLTHWGQARCNDFTVDAAWALENPGCLPSEQDAIDALAVDETRPGVNQRGDWWIEQLDKAKRKAKRDEQAAEGEYSERAKPTTQEQADEAARIRSRLVPPLQKFRKQQAS